MANKYLTDLYINSNPSEKCETCRYNEKGFCMSFSYWGTHADGKCSYGSYQEKKSDQNKNRGS